MLPNKPIWPNVLALAAVAAAVLFLLGRCTA